MLYDGSAWTMEQTYAVLPIGPLRIGNVIFLTPIKGVSDEAFRLLCSCSRTYPESRGFYAVYLHGPPHPATERNQLMSLSSYASVEELLLRYRDFLQSRHPELCSDLVSLNLAL